MGKFNELDIDRIEGEEFEGWDDLPTNEAIPQSELDEIRMQQSAAISDLREAEKALREMIDLWKYYEERPELKFLEKILSLVTAARRTIA